MTGHTLARLALLADALLAATVLCAPGRPRRARRGRGALVLTPVLLAGELWHSTQVEHLRHHPALAAAGIVAALAVVGALVLVVRVAPAPLALLAVVALPFRFSVLAGGTGGILIALYVVIAAGAIAFLLEGDEREPRAGGARARARRCSSCSTRSRRSTRPRRASSKAVEDVGFFLVPFSLLYVLLRRVPWDRALLTRCARAVVALALLFVAVAAVEYASRRLLFNTALNANARFFRVNSLFYDPNIFGRFLALTMRARHRGDALGGATAGGCWRWRRCSRCCGSGCSGRSRSRACVALLAGLAVLGAARFSLRWTAAAAAVVLAAPVSRSRCSRPAACTCSSANNATSDRATLVEHRDRPVRRPPARGLRLGIVLLRVPAAHRPVVRRTRPPE